MRPWSSMLGIASLVVLCVALVSMDGEGAELLEADDFDGPDGSSPNATMWNLSETDSDDTCRIYGDALRTHSTGNGYAVIYGKAHYETNNLTFLVDHKLTVYHGRSIDVRINSHDGTRYYRWICVMFDADAGYGTVNYRWGGAERTIVYNQDYVQGRWYTVNITVMTDKFTVVITETGTSTEFLRVVNQSCDALGSDNYVHIGVFQYHTTSSAEAYYDNYRLLDVSPYINKPPVWGDLPVLRATEDVPVTYDFSANVSDPDDDMDLLSISSTSEYVVSISRFNVTFQFGEGVTEAVVRLFLNDGRLMVWVDVEFVVTPVNDPPGHEIPMEMSAVEDVPYSVLLEPFVWDIDNENSELTLEVDDPFATSDGLTLTVLFTEGVTDYYLTIYISDGLARTGGVIHFTITPVDDPPQLGPLDEFQAVEDRDSVLDLSAYITDPDTPISSIRLLVYDPNCTVEGRTLHVLCTRGGVAFGVTVRVTDGATWVTSPLNITVLEVNDAPVISPLLAQVFTEEERRTIDLRPFVSDEESPDSALVLGCEHPSVVSTDSLHLTMEYMVWEPPHTVEICVSDGMATTYTNISVSVRDVNDAPRLRGSFTTGWPGIIRIDEGGWEDAHLFADDEDDTDLTWTVESDFPGFELLGNNSTYRTLRVSAEKGDVGEFFANITVTDPSGALDTKKVRLIVRNVNDPPAVPLILSPANNSIFLEGQNITFDVSVFDPDMVLGQVLNVTWTTNVTGLLMERSTEEDMGFVTDALRPGVYRVEVAVSDGEFERSAWVQVIVEAEPGPPPPEEPSFQVMDTIQLILLIVAVVVLVTILIVQLSRGRKETEPVEIEGAHEVPTVVAEVPEGPAEAAGWVAEEDEP